MTPSSYHLALKIHMRLSMRQDFSTQRHLWLAMSTKLVLYAKGLLMERPLRWFTDEKRFLFYFELDLSVSKTNTKVHVLVAYPVSLIRRARVAAQSRCKEDLWSLCKFLLLLQWSLSCCTNVNLRALTSFCRAYIQVTKTGKICLEWIFGTRRQVSGTSNRIEKPRAFAICKLAFLD